MKELKPLGDFLSFNDDYEETYTNDQKSRFKRARQGYYSRNSDCFDFIYLVNNWKDIVGPLLGANSIPLKILKRTLVVATKHSIFSQEMSLMSQELIKKIEAQFPAIRGSINKLSFYHSEQLFQKKRALKEKQPIQSTPSFNKYSPAFVKAKSKATELFSDIEDQEIKEILINLYIERQLQGS